MNDTWIAVYVRRFHSHNPSEFGERVEVLVRIPETVVRSLAGQEPEADKLWMRAANVAHLTIGAQVPFSTTVLSQVDSSIPAKLPEKSFRDEDGCEGWVLSTGSAMPDQS
jgi:hypothetical protein